VVVVAKPPHKTARGVIWPVLQSSGGKLDRFIVWGKVDHPKIRGQVDFFLFFVDGVASGCGRRHVVDIRDVQSGSNEQGRITVDE
jgi:hypothetical protein